MQLPHVAAVGPLERTGASGLDIQPNPDVGRVGQHLTVGTDQPAGRGEELAPARQRSGAMRSSGRN